MDTLLAFLIGTLLTFVFVRRYVKTLAVPKHRATAHASSAASAPPRNTTNCPRCGRSISMESSFCDGCGASMALWNVHRAAVQVIASESNAAEKGKPKPVINATLCIGCGTCVDSCPETGTLALVGGKALLANQERCTGHAKCVEVCPTSAITLSFGSMLQTLRVPLVKEDFETNVEGIYIAGELCGMGLIKTAINEGRLSIDTIRRKLDEEGEWNPPHVAQNLEESGDQPNAPSVVPSMPAAPDRPYDVIIVGAGPAGLSASLAAQQHGLHFLTLEQGEVASTIRNYPRHKFLMAEPIEMPLYGNLYIGDGTKEALLKVWEAIISNTGIQISTQERVESIRREEQVLVVETGKGLYRTRNVVLAMGKRGTPRKLNVPGEELGKVTYRLIEADTYDRKNILVVGGGDSAIEAALAVSKACKNRVTLSYRGASFDRARERNRNMLEDAESHGRVSILRNSSVMEIMPETVRLLVDGAERVLPNDYVFILIGGESPESFLRKTGIEIVDKAITAA